MSPNTAATPTAAAASSPVFGRAALAILGSMLLLIAALTVVLVQTTWAATDTSVESVESSNFAQR